MSEIIEAYLKLSWEQYLKYLEGRADCSNGVPARMDDSAYRRGYGEQYAKEQQEVARSGS